MRSRSRCLDVLVGLLFASMVMPGTARAGSPPAMVTLPAGTLHPLYGRAGDAPLAVRSFRLDRDPVTRGEFLAFVRGNAEWRRSAVRPAAAGAGYLAAWRADLDAGDATDLRRPVTSVSVHAATAYCAAQGKRLPTLAEWEYAAAASETATNARGDAAFAQRLVSLYATRPRPLPPVGRGRPNAFGVRGLHDLAWEWVADFSRVQKPHAVGDSAAATHDLFCASAALGAADPSNYAAFLRNAIRGSVEATTAMESLGFRCAA